MRSSVWREISGGHGDDQCDAADLGAGRLMDDVAGKWKLSCECRVQAMHAT